MNKEQKLADLRHILTRYALPHDRPPVPFGAAAVDAVLGGGLKRGAVHEVFARDWGAGGFAALLAQMAAASAFAGTGGPLFWVRPDYEALEYGALHPPGLLELGGDPGNLVLVRAPHAAEALSAAHDILGCPHVGALVLELCGQPRMLDLTASRRLGLAAEESGVTLFVLREGAREEASATHTRWEVSSLASRDDDDDWGAPCFETRLTRHRGGSLGEFLLEWNCNLQKFTPSHHSSGRRGADTARSYAGATHHPPPLAPRARGREA